MSAIVPTAVDTIQFTDDEKVDAAALANQIEGTLADIEHDSRDLLRNFATLGCLLKAVQDKGYWSVYGFTTFGQYILSVEAKFEKGRSSLYSYIGVARQLLPHISEEQLQRIGISKASELARTIKKTGKNPSAAIISRAENPKVSVSELKAELFSEYNISEYNDRGHFYDFGGGFLTPDQRGIFDRAKSVAERIEPAIPRELPEHIRRVMVYERWAAEFLATYEKEVEGGS